MINIRLPLKELRKSKGITQSDFSRIMNVAPSTVGMWEQGYREPDYSNLNRIADFFQVTTDYLLGRDRNERAAENPYLNKYLRLDAPNRQIIDNLIDKILIAQNAAQ